MPSALSRILATTAEIIRPPPERDAGQWAEDCRTLPPDSPEPGRFRVSRTPYMYDIYAAFADDRIKMVVGVMGAQMGKTEGIFNILGWSLDDRPLPAMYVGPTEKQVRSISSDRLMKMFRSTKTLWEKLEKGQRNKVSEKFIAGVRLGFAWAGSATELASHPCGLILVDERDRMVNTDEGDPVTLSTARTKNYARGKVGVFSTPTIEGASPVWALFLEGTRKMWAWQCLECDDWFVPKLELLKWPEGANPSEAAAQAVLVCPHCGIEHDDSQKHQLEQRGRYIAHTVNDIGEVVPTEESAPNVTESFWVSGLCSPWQSFGDIARRLVAAYKTNDQDRIQAEVNTYGGEIFKIRGDAPPWEQVRKLIMPYGRGSLPQKVQIITAGVDVQKYGLYYTVRGWGYMSESWLLDHGYIAGETEFDNVWISLHQVLSQKFDGRPIARAFIDSGFAADRVYDFVRRIGGNVYASKGQERMTQPLRTNVVDVTQKGKMLKAGVQLWHINTDYYKSQVYARVRWPLDQPGGWHLHEDTDEDYCRQLVSESVVTKASGRRIWVRHYKDNHYLDCEVLAFAAASSMQVHTLKEKKRETAPENKKLQKPVNPSQQQSFIKKRQNWMRR